MHKEKKTDTDNTWTLQTGPDNIQDSDENLKSKKSATDNQWTSANRK